MSAIILPNAEVAVVVVGLLAAIVVGYVLLARRRRADPKIVFLLGLLRCLPK
jgi:hypothetical protein